MVFQSGIHCPNVGSYPGLVKRFLVLIVVCAVTQADQDDADKAKQRESVQTLVQTWLDSLQLISVIVSKIPSPLTLPKLNGLVPSRLHSLSRLKPVGL